jgi:hypothetical protein
LENRRDGLPRIGKIDVKNRIGAMRRMGRWLSAGLSLVMAAPWAPAQAPAAGTPPAIAHEASTHAVRGQSMTVKAKVTDDAGAVKAVTLFVTLSRDAAPFRIPLKPAGSDLYVGTIDAGMLASVKQFSYYIEAEDESGATRETPWYKVELREPGAGGAAAGTPGAAPAEEKSGWSTVLIAGGAAAAVGGALLLASGSSDDGDGGGGGGDVPADAQGTYAGRATTCLTLSGQAPACQSKTVVIVISADGQIVSDDLSPGGQVAGKLNGSSFTLTSQYVDPANGNANDVIYSGSVGDGRIIGQISGSSSGPAGDGTFSGSFSLTRQ